MTTPKNITVFGRALDPQSAEFRAYQDFINGLDFDGNGDLTTEDITQWEADGSIFIRSKADGTKYMMETDIRLLTTQGPGVFLLDDPNNTALMDRQVRSIVGFFNFLHQFDRRNLPVYMAVESAPVGARKLGEGTQKQKYREVISSSLDKVDRSSRESGIVRQSFSGGEYASPDSEDQNFNAVVTRMYEGLSQGLDKQLGITPNDILEAADYVDFIFRNQAYDNFLPCIGLQPEQLNEIIQALPPETYQDFLMLSQSLNEVDLYTGGVANDLLWAALQWNKGLKELAQTVQSRNQCL